MGKKVNVLDDFIKNDILNGSHALDFIYNTNANEIKKYNRFRNISGIYFLFKNNEIVYIGKSVSIFRRILEHKHNFDSFSYIELPKEKLDIYEKLFILKYNPEYNTETFTHRSKIILTLDSLVKTIKNKIKKMNITNEQYGK